jgi:hypothetical protein
MSNLDTWDKFADIDPKFTKAITGKQYKGTSPNPQYVIRCLTELFGPVGQGFGWRVIAEDFTPLGGETLHWCRIEFWHTDRANVVESYGQTKAAYITSGGKQMVDEDAPKKSLTDAIIKAASWVGIGANIFLGRWDDQKYVSEVAKSFEDVAPVDTAKVDAAIAKIEAANNGRELLAVLADIGPDNSIDAIAAARIDRLVMFVKGAQTVAQLDAYKANFAPDWSHLQQHADNRRKELTPPADDLAGDAIPY